MGAVESKLEDIEMTLKDIAKTSAAIRDVLIKKEFVSYKEMLQLNERKFKKMLTTRTEKSFIDDLLEEMIEHETETNSFGSVSLSNRTHTDGERLIYRNVARGEQIILEVFRERGLDKDTREKIEKETNVDVMLEAILAKAASDYFRLGEEK